MGLTSVILGLYGLKYALKFLASAERRALLAQLLKDVTEEGSLMGL